jgi:hypothetical protein
LCGRHHANSHSDYGTGCDSNSDSGTGCDSDANVIRHWRHADLTGRWIDSNGAARWNYAEPWYANSDAAARRATGLAD